MRRRIIVVHGWGGSPQGDWMEWAKQELTKLGYEVYVPEMPESNYPKIQTWVSYLTSMISQPRENDILIGHSIGCQTILRYLEALSENRKVDKVILVAGWVILKGLTQDEKPIAFPWEQTPITWDKVKTRANLFVAIFSDDDPVVPLEENRKTFEEKLGAKIVVEKNQGHFNQETLPILSKYL